MHMSMPHHPDFVYCKARKVLEGEQASIEIQMVPVCKHLKTSGQVFH